MYGPIEQARRDIEIPIPPSHAVLLHLFRGDKRMPTGAWSPGETYDVEGHAVCVCDGGGEVGEMRVGGQRACRQSLATLLR